MTQKDETQPTGAGRSSFERIDSAKFFSELNLKKGITLLDVACGRGNYSLAAADIIGKNSQIYAVDLWEEGILFLRQEAAARGIANISAFVSDVSQHIPVGDHCVDVCLMATVLHDFVGDKVEQGVMQEIVRVIESDSTLAVVEYKKKEGQTGPPQAVRLSPEEVVKIVSAYGFKQNRYAEIGSDHYLQIFKKRQ